MRPNIPIAALLALISALLVVTSCAKKVPLTEDQKIYAGKWTSDDGKWIEITEAGGGNYDLKGESVKGGGAVIANDTIKIEVLGLGSTFKVEAAPSQLEDGTWTMTLDGVVYKKPGQRPKGS